MQERINRIIMEKSFCENITPEMNLSDDLGLESLGMVELIVELEDEFNIEFDESFLEPEDLQTVGQIYLLVQRHIGE